MTTETAESQRSRGRLARKAIPRRKLGEFTPLDRDPVALIVSTDEGRIPELIPLRHERMAASHFAFFRGSAGLMAHDLAQQAQTDTHLVICGDAHINNFGLYASPERRLVFDLNDFDEAAPGPWEWDVKRLVTSAVLAGRENGLSAEDISDLATATATAYRQGLAKLLEMPSLARHYVSIDETDLAAAIKDHGVKQLKAATRKAKRRDSDRAIAQLMGPDNMGFIRFKEDPPILTHHDNATRDELQHLMEQYRSTTLADISFLLSRYEVTDIAMRVVGVGSVGTRCHLIALTGPEGEGLVMQAKEAGESVVTAFTKPNFTTPETLTEEMSGGERVVSHQRILQAVSDPFLGSVSRNGISYYLRQYRDAKGGFDTTIMDGEGLRMYSALCAQMLARAHSQSPLAHWVNGYIGDSDVFDKAIAKWSLAYADQVKIDFNAFHDAIQDGRVSVFSEGQNEAVAATAAANS